MSKESKIVITVTRDDNNIPEKITWRASDTEFENDLEALAFTLSLWDKKEKNTMSIDLWNKDMTIEDMTRFMHQKFQKMADSYEAATTFKEVGTLIRDFAGQFSEKVKETVENSKS